MTSADAMRDYSTALGATYHPGDDASVLLSTLRARLDGLEQRAGG